MSSKSSGPPGSLAYVSEILGFLSFTFTLATVVRVFWTNLITLGNAHRDVPNALATLKQELYEEREHLRRARQREHVELRGGAGGSRRASRSGRRPKYERTMTGYDGGKPAQLMNDTMRSLWRRFKNLEKPFLRPRDRRNEKRDLEEGRGIGDEDQYVCSVMDLRKRILWAWRKNEAEALADSLQRLQTRRIAREMTDALWTVQHVDRKLSSRHTRIYDA